MSASVIASALLAAVNLSISSPDDYHYVAITQTNSLDGVGMSQSGGGVSVRYEDIAFLAEALKERKEFLGYYSGGYERYSSRQTVDGDIDGDLRQYFQYAYLTGASSETRKADYFDASVILPSGTVNVATLSSSGVRTLNIDVFRKLVGEPYKLSCTTKDFAEGGPLTEDSMKRAYGDVESLTRVAYIGAKQCSLNATYGVVERQETVQHGPEKNATDYSIITQEVGTASRTQYTEPCLSYTFMHRKYKTQYFNTTTDGDGKLILKPVGECKATNEWYHGSSITYRNSTFLDPRPGYENLGKRKCKSVKVYALCKFTYELLEILADGTNRRTNKYGTFAVPVSASLEAEDFPALVYISADGTDFIKGLYSTGCSLYGVTEYDSAESLPVEEPDNPSTDSSYTDFETEDNLIYREEGAKTDLSVSVIVKNFVLVYDMEFNARVKGDGE